MIQLFVSSCSTGRKAPRPTEEYDEDLPVLTGSKANQKNDQKHAPAPTPAKSSTPQVPTQSPPSVTSSASSSPQPAVPAAEQTAYDEIYAHFQKQEFALLVPKAREFEKRFRKSTLLHLVLNLRGLSELGLKKYSEADDTFSRAVALAAPPSDAYYRFNLATARFESKHLDLARFALDSIDLSALDSTTRFKFYFLKARIHTQLQEIPQAVEALFFAASTAPQPTAEQTNALDLQLAQTLLNPTDRQKIKAVIEANASSSLYPKALSILHPVARISDPDPKKIGILLPQTGKFAKYGQQALHGIELVLQDQKFTKAGFTYVVEDSGETPEAALSALTRLYQVHKVIGVIGPLVSKGIELVTRRSAEMELPLLALTQQNGIQDSSVIYFATSPMQQARDIAQYAIQKRGLKRFAIIYPKNRFGEEYSQYFWDAVEEFGGRVVDFEGYDPKETDFRDPVDRVLGLGYPESRWREIEEQAQKRKELQITKRTRQTEKYFTLPPIQQFDAVFIPDEAKIVTQILPTFSYRDADNIQSIGISAWNSTSLIERAPEAVQGALFPDTFFAQSTQPEFLSFVESFENKFEYSPSALEMMSYNAASLMQSILINHGVSSHSELLQKLSTTQDFPTPSGKLKFLNGRMTQPLKILTVVDTEIKEVQ